MKKTILIVFIFGACILTTTGDQTLSFQNGNKIYARLLGEFGTEWTYAVGYIMGVHDTLNGEYFSSPKEVTQDQILSIVEKYLEDHPEKRHYAAPSLIGQALQEAFPKKTPAFPQGGNNGND